MNINWKADPKTKIASFFGLTEGSKSISDAMDKFRKDLKSASYQPTFRYQLASALNLLIGKFGPKKDLYDLTTGEVSKYFGNNPDLKRKTSLALRKLYKSLGDSGINRSIPDPKKGQTKQSVSLEIIEADETDILDFIEAGRYNGTFGPMKLSIRDALLSCPPNQFRVIPWSPGMIQDDNERQRTLLAIRDVTEKEPRLKNAGWKCLQSFGRKSFFIVRPEQLEKAKQLLKGEVNVTRLSSGNGSSGENGTSQSKSKSKR